MPETLAPPATPAAPAPSAPPAAPSPQPGATDGGPGTEIHVTPATVDKGPVQPAPKRGSAMDKLMTDLRSKAKPQFYESAPGETSPAQPQPGQPQPAAEPTKTAGDTIQSPAASPEKPDGKRNPWKLVDEYKARASKAETDLLEFRKSGVDPALKKSFEEEITKLKTQNEELEKHLRYVDYAKSAEFKNKYQQPYEKAWERAAREVAEIRITDPQTGEQRPATTQDLYNVVVSPLNEARDLADSIFGKFADDVMQYRKEIRALNDAQEAALKEAKDNSIQRDKQLQEQQQTFLNKTAGEIKQVWDQANHEFAERQDLAFIFKPADSDEDHKSRLTKGFALVDKAFATNSADPRLTPEQRAEAVKMHAAVRMRAAGFGPLRAKYDAALTKIAALEKELGQFKQTVPPVGGTSGQEPSATNTGKAWDQIRSGLQKIAKPVG